MKYQVYTPSAGLQPFIKCFWSLDDEEQQETVKQKVLPDGCMEMIFHYGDLYLQFFEDGSNIIQPRSFVFGQITKYIEIAPTGISGIIAARFLPDGISPFLNTPLTSLENKAVPVKDLFREEGVNLEVQVLNANDNEERIKLIETFLLSKLTERRTIDSITKSCVDIIFQSQGKIGSTELADKMNISRRNMERKFTSAIGMSPKQLARVARLQATLKMLEQKDSTTLTEIAYENGYFDQAHFIKDFREFTGMSPKSVFADNLKLSSIFTNSD
jgi:AraC-like DNA-binding protein